MPIFENTANIVAKLGTTDVVDTSTVQISMVDVFFQKEVDQSVWREGPLEYTITVANYSETETLTEIQVQDMIDLSFTRLMEDTIALVPAAAGTYTYNTASGELAFTLNDILPQNTVVITFRVDRVLP